MLHKWNAYAGFYARPLLLGCGVVLLAGRSQMWLVHGFVTPYIASFIPSSFGKEQKGFFLKKVLLEKGTEISSLGKRELKKLFICG